MHPGRRLYKLSFLSGLILALPVLAGTAWYAWSAYAVADRHRRATDPQEKIDAELYQIVLHDELVRDGLRLMVRERDPRGPMPVISLSVTRANLDAMTSVSYVDALVEKDGKTHDAKVRYRGDQPWHTQGVQKSMKVRIDRGDLLDGARVFNLLNDPTPFGLEDQIILDLARENGLLAPEYRPARVRLNNTDLGVFRYATQPDETLLRRARRMPGNMYSFDDQAWQKIASRSAEEEADQSELTRFLAALDSSHEHFARYAEDELDLERFAMFDALDVVFGGSEHDYQSNHKMYADPYRGKMEPVAFSFRGFQHKPIFNLIDYPLLVRLKMTPGYLALRDRAVYELLTTKASVPSIRERTDRAAEGLLAELAVDPYWDAYKLLPKKTRLHRFLVRPMTLEKWLVSAENELDLFAERSRFLLDALEDPALELARTAVSEHLSKVELAVGGHGAYQLKSIHTRAECAGELELYADVNLDGVFEEGRDMLLARSKHGETAKISRYRELRPASVLVPQEEPSKKRGNVRVAEATELYRYFLRSKGACTPDQVAVELTNLVTGAPVFEILSEGTVSAENANLDRQRAPMLVAGERSVHPWAFPETPAPAVIALGPGVVNIEKTRNFAANETVEIAAGTTLQLGRGASLIFRGRVFARGTVERPINLVRLDRQVPFGGIALQGPGTEGSVLTQVNVRGGSQISGETIRYSAVLSLHDTHDLTLEAITLSGGGEAGDVLHANHVEALSLHDLTIEAAPVDAIDLEQVQGEARGLRIYAAGDDCLDLMGADLLVQDSVMSGCKNNAISAGEETHFTGISVLIADSKTGVLAKNASNAKLLRSLIYRTGRATHTKTNEIRYAGDSHVGLAEVTTDGVPGENELARLLVQVLGLTDWSELDQFLAHRERSASL